MCNPIGQRCYIAVTAPFDMGQQAIHCLIPVLIALESLLFLGSRHRFFSSNEELRTELGLHFAHVIIYPPLFLLGLLNPAYYSTPFEGNLADPIITDDWLEEQSCSPLLSMKIDNCFPWQINARFCYAVKMVAVTIATIVDGIIGLLALIPALCLFARCTSLNDFALYRFVNMGRIAGDIYEGVLGIINPSACILLRS